MAWFLPDCCQPWRHYVQSSVCRNSEEVMFDEENIKPLSMGWLDDEIKRHKGQRESIKLPPGTFIKILVNARKNPATELMADWIGDKITQCHGNPYDPITILPKPYVDLLNSCKKSARV
jgi:hypothetical protein